LNEDPASKTAKHIVNEVKAIFKKCLNVEKDLQEVLEQPLSDDFLNLIEIASSIKPRALVSGDEASSASEDEVIGEVPPLLIGITFLNKHCYVPDIYSDKGKSEPLVKRSVQLKFDFLRDFLGWQLLVIDENEFAKLPSKKEKEAYISKLLHQPDEEDDDE